VVLAVFQVFFLNKVEFPYCDHYVTKTLKIITLTKPILSLADCKNGQPVFEDTGKNKSD